jgi:putative transposase
VLAWRLSNTLSTDFCLEAVQEAVTRYGRPDRFNTDQGRQFTSLPFTGLLKDHGIQISMDGAGCWRDNVFVERLWRSVKYEEVYLRAYDSISAAHHGLEQYLTFYNQRRPHQALDGHTPDAVYFDNLPALPTAT